MYEQFRRLLIDYRKQNKLSRREMADLLFVSESLIGMYERGERNVSLEVTTNLCKLTGKEIKVTIEHAKEKPVPNHYQIYQTIEKTFPDWIQLGNDNGRGMHRMMKTIRTEKDLPVTVIIYESGLYLFKIEDEHKAITESQYHELFDNDPTPYVDEYIKFNDRDEFVLTPKTMPFGTKTNQELIKHAHEFIKIANGYSNI